MSQSRDTWIDTLVSAAKPAALTSFDVPSGLRVMVIGPHPDDFDANGIAHKYLDGCGCTLRVLVMRSGSGIEDSYCSPPTLEVKERIREQEQRASCRFFGLSEESLAFLDMEQDSDAQPLDSAPNRGILAGEILSFRPDMVMLPHGSDTNQGHCTVYAMVSDTLRRAGLPIAALLSRDPKTISMRADFYVPFGEEQAEWKAELLRFHDSQHQRNLNTRGHGFDERILAINRNIARELGIDAPYAEAFELVLFWPPCGE